MCSLVVHYHALGTRILVLSMYENSIVIVLFEREDYKIDPHYHVSN